MVRTCVCVMESGEERKERKASAWCALRQAKTKGRATGKAKKQRGGRIRMSEQSRPLAMHGKAETPRTKERNSACDHFVWFSSVLLFPSSLSIDAVGVLLLCFSLNFPFSCVFSSSTLFAFTLVRSCLFSAPYPELIAIRGALGIGAGRSSGPGITRLGVWPRPCYDIYAHAEKHKSRPIALWAGALIRPPLPWIDRLRPIPTHWALAKATQHLDQYD